MCSTGLDKLHWEIRQLRNACWSVAFVLCLLGSRLAAEQQMVALRENGSPNELVNIVLLGDGYTSAEMQGYSDYVHVVVDEIFKKQPFAAYEPYFNVYRVDVVSNESGADKPRSSVFVDTALDARYYCEGRAAAVCVDDRAVDNAIRQSRPPGFPVDGWHIPIVLVNDSEYAGTAQKNIAVVSALKRPEDTANLVLHEVGHTFGLLGDEYGGVCSRSEEPDYPNIASGHDPDSLNWAHWIEAGTRVPSTSITAGVVSAFEGAYGCDSQYYRPTYRSKMRADGEPFERANQETLIRAIHGEVRFITRHHPPESTVSVTQCRQLLFSIQPLPLPRAASVSREIAWYVGGRMASRESFLDLDTCSVANGSHAVRVELRHRTVDVRRDPSESLIDVHEWELVVIR